MTVSPLQAESIKEDIRVIGDTVSELLDRVVQHDARFDQIDARLDQHDARFDQIDQRLGGIDDVLRQILAQVSRDRP